MEFIIPFPGAYTKAMKNCVSSDLEKKPDLVIVHTGTNDCKSVNSHEEIVNEIISLALFVKKRATRLQFCGLLTEQIDSSKNLRMLTTVW